MSTPNYYSMDNFPLYVRDFYAIMGYCPACHLIQDADNDCCECCEGRIEASERYDEFEASDTLKDIETAINNLEDPLLFHKLSVRYGYYSGVQFYVEEIYDNVQMLTNRDCRYEFDLYRSQALRKYASECKRIERILKRLADEFGFEEIYRLGVFSNGEALYCNAKKKAS